MKIKKTVYVCAGITIIGVSGYYIKNLLAEDKITHVQLSSSHE